MQNPISAHVRVGGLERDAANVSDVFYVAFIFVIVMFCCICDAFILRFCVCYQRVTRHVPFDHKACRPLGDSNCFSPLTRSLTRNTVSSQGLL